MSRRMPQYGVDPGVSPSEAGQMLWRENHRSINYRYSERNRTPSYSAKTTEAKLNPVAVLKAISCYGYQSCERPDWNKSKSYQLIEQLTAAILEAHPELKGNYHNRPDYDSAPWGFDSVDQAVQVSARSN